MGTVVVSAVIFGIIGWAAYRVFKGRKNGRICGGCEHCSGCPYRAQADGSDPH